MNSQQAYNKLNRARIYLLGKKDYLAICFLDSHIYKYFRYEEEKDFQSGESTRKIKR